MTLRALCPFIVNTFYKAAHHVKSLRMMLGNLMADRAKRMREDLDGDQLRPRLKVLVTESTRVHRAACACTLVIITTHVLLVIEH